MIKVAIMGATGYGGLELVRLLLSHKNVEIVVISSQNNNDVKYNTIYQNMLKHCDLTLQNLSMQEISERADVIFCATPSGFAAKNVDEKVLENAKVIDLSADFRFSNDLQTFKDVYKVDHLSQKVAHEAVYGIPEMNRDKIKNARLIANPGCYCICSILSLYPLIKEKVLDISSIIIDAKSGITGAGREVKIGNMFVENNENFKAYNPLSHRHKPEIENALSNINNEKIILNFVPHLVNMNRGLLCSIYANIKCDENKVREIYNDYYKNEKFIRILDEGIYPQTRFVKHSNYLDLSFSIDKRSNKIIIISAIDNLMRGASSNAIANMNLAFGLEESQGLDLIPFF